MSVWAWSDLVMGFELFADGVRIVPTLGDAVLFSLAYESLDLRIALARSRQTNNGIWRTYENSASPPESDDGSH